MDITYNKVNSASSSFASSDVSKTKSSSSNLRHGSSIMEKVACVRSNLEKIDANYNGCLGYYHIRNCYVGHDSLLFKIAEMDSKKEFCPQVFRGMESFSKISSVFKKIDEIIFSIESQYAHLLINESESLEDHVGSIERDVSRSVECFNLNVKQVRNKADVEIGEVLATLRELENEGLASGLARLMANPAKELSILISGDRFVDQQLEKIDSIEKEAFYEIGNLHRKTLKELNGLVKNIRREDAKINNIWHLKESVVMEFKSLKKLLSSELGQF